MYVATIGVFALLYNIPRFWEVTWQTRTYENLNATITNVEPTELRNDPTYINVYITWLYLVVMYIIPFTCLAIFNLLIYKEVSLTRLLMYLFLKLRKSVIESIRNFSADFSHFLHPFWYDAHCISYFFICILVMPFNDFDVENKKMCISKKWKKFTLMLAFFMY